MEAANGSAGRVVTAPKRPRACRRLWVILLGTAGGGVLFTGLAATLISLTRVLTQLAALCTTETCVQYGALLRDSVSAATDPCEDFYGHICGHWAFSLSVRESLFEKYIGDVAQHNRETVVPTSNQNAAQKAALFFQVCENIVAHNRTEIETVRRLLIDVGLYDPLPKPFTESLLNITLLLNIIWAFDTPLQVIPLERKNSVHIEVSVGSFFLEHARRLNNDNEEQHRAIFARLQPYMEHIHSPDVSLAHVNALDTRATNVLSASLSPSLNYTTESIDKIENLVPELPPYVWSRHLRFYFSDVTAIQIRVQDRTFFRQYFALPEVLNVTDMQVYMRWYMLLELSLMTDSSAFSLWHGGYKAAKKARARYCFEAAHTLMKGALTATYVNARFGGRVLADIGDLIKQIRSAHAYIFSKAGPLDALKRSEYLADTAVPSFEAVVESNEDVLVRSFQNYSDMTMDMTLNWRIASVGLRASTSVKDAAGLRVAWPTASVEVHETAFYNPYTLSLLPVLAAGPFFDAQKPFALKLAGAGSVISEVLVTQLWRHVQDWDLQPRKELESQRLCLSNSTAQNAGAAKLSAKATRFDADYILKLVVSLRGLLAAYRRSGEKIALSIKDLPGFNGPQLLYAGWCYMYCAEPGGRVLCNEPLRETPEFARAFRCSPSASMSKANVCTTHWFTSFR